MSSVTVSSGYRVVIPREIREAMAIRPGQKLPVKPIQELRGSLPGIESAVARDEDRV